MITYALDANITSYLLQKREKVIRRLKEERDKGNKIAIPPIVYYEIRRGLLASGATTKAELFKTLYSELGINNIDQEMLEMAAVEHARLRKLGRPIEDADLFIAMYCIKNDYILVTNNTRHFEIIKNLNYVNWAE